MKTRGHAIGGGDSIIRAPHNAPYTIRSDNVIQLAGRNPCRPCTRLHGPEARTGHASLSSRASLKLAQVANAVFEVSKVILLLTYALIGGAAITFSILFWLFLVQF